MPDREGQSFAEFAVTSGVRVPCAGNLPLDLDDPEFVWFVERGAVDVFLVELPKGEERSAPQHLMRIEEGRLLPGVTPQAGKTTLGLTAKGLWGTVLRRVPIASLAGVQPDNIAALIDSWIVDIGAMLARDVIFRPQPDVFVETGELLQAGNGRLSVRRGVAWLGPSSPESALFMDLVEVAASSPAEGPDVIPVTSASWITLSSPQQISTVSSETLWTRGQLLRSLENFHKLALSLERLNRSLAIADQYNLDRADMMDRRIDEDRARSRLFDPYGLSGREGEDREDFILGDVLRLVGKHEGICFEWPKKATAPDFVPSLDEILDVSGARRRLVRLTKEDRWWIGDSGAMLGFRADDGRPVALLPGTLGRYRIVDPTTGRTTSVTSRNAATLRGEAWSFCRPLTSNSAGWRDLLQIARKGMFAGVARFAAAGLLGGLIMVLPAAMFGFIADRVIPASNVGLLYTVTAVLALFAVVWALTHVFQGMALMRIEGRAAARIEAAFWDRLLRLPLRFLHRYPTGDRAMRGMTFQRIRDAVQGQVANDALSVVFLVPALAAIFLYDAALGGVATAFGLLCLSVTVLLGLFQAPPHGRAARAVNRLTGRLFQIFNGIAKLRVAGAEGSAFAAWARDFSEQQHAELELGAREALLRAFGAGLPLFAGAVLLLAATLRGTGTLTVGEFLFIYIAFTVFVTGLVRLGASFGAVATIVSEYTHVRPFLAETPETSIGGEPVEHLGGDVVFDRVTFRYVPDGPLILYNVSIKARPGEFVAIAGESGAGKSTLFRLALGVNQPTSGAIYFDRRDLRQLNVKQLRRKIGAVPQEVQLHPQDIWDNIVGEQDDASADAVWQAARTAAVDEEIAAMPMGMLTCVGDSSSVTSGGESQRIMIARALMRNPRILLFDEATNWLDNETQARIMENLAQMTSTRIVIAHRLSTLRQADRIYVLDAGKVVQEGTFAELTMVEGAFRDLVRHQET